MLYNLVGKIKTILMLLDTFKTDNLAQNYLNQFIFNCVSVVTVGISNPHHLLNLTKIRIKILFSGVYSGCQFMSQCSCSLVKLCLYIFKIPPLNEIVNFVGC